MVSSKAVKSSHRGWVARIAYRSRIVRGTYVQADERLSIGGRFGTTIRYREPCGRAAALIAALVICGFSEYSHDVTIPCGPTVAAIAVSAVC